MPKGDFQTVAGFMLLKLAHPGRGRGFRLARYQFTVRDMDVLRIKKVLAGKTPSIP